MGRQAVLPNLEVRIALPSEPGGFAATGASGAFHGVRCKGRAYVEFRV